MIARGPLSALASVDIEEQYGPTWAEEKGGSPVENNVKKESARTYPNAQTQTEWYKRNRGVVITVRLMEGATLSGVLLDWDTYTIALQRPGYEEPILINKHAICFLSRREAKKDEGNRQADGARETTE